MEKIKLKVQPLENYQEIKDEILSSPLGVKIINALNISDEELYENYDLLLQYIHLNKSCANCKSIKKCDHSTRGYQFTLKRDMIGLLTDSLAVCDVAHEYYTKKNNIVYTTFNEETLLDNTSTDFLKDNGRTLGRENLTKIIRLQRGEIVTGLYFSLTDSKIRKNLIIGLSSVLLINNPCVIAKFPDLVRNLRGQWKNQVNEDLFKLVLNAKVLLIDDVAGEAISSFSRDEVLLPLLDYRMQHDLVTILCSQYDVDKLASLYKLGYNDGPKGELIVEKIKELTR